MPEFRIHIFHTGSVCVATALPFGGEHCSFLRAAGVFTRKQDRLWLPVSAYLIESEHGKILFDTGWNRRMSPKGVFDRKAQIESLGSLPLYMANQGVLPEGAAIDEQLGRLGIKPSELDLVLLSHLDCDHANGLNQVREAKRILVSSAELSFAEAGPFTNRFRYCRSWWKDTGLQTFTWNGTEGPAHKSYDVFGNGSFVMVNIPGHSEGQCALRISRKDGRFALLYADGGYATRSWKELIPSGIADDRVMQMQSLEWIRAQSMDTRCIASIANHDPDVKPEVIEL